jgi:hypothetical protein
MLQQVLGALRNIQALRLHNGYANSLDSCDVAPQIWRLYEVLGSRADRAQGGSPASLLGGCSMLKRLHSMWCHATR